MIGVPGMSAGNAWYDSAAQRVTPQNPVTQGPLIGYLTLDSEIGVANANAYTFVFTPYNASDTGQYAVVDSCAVTATSNCAIVVGKQIQFQLTGQGPDATEHVTWLHECDPQPGVNGLNVMILDRVTLFPLNCTTVTSTSALQQVLQFSTPPIAPTEGTHEQLQSAYFNDRVVVVIQSVGTLLPLPACFPNPNVNPPVLCPNLTPVSPTISYADDPTLRLIDQLGGTPETFATAIGAPATGATLPGAYPYALIGVASNLPWHGKGVESSPLITPGQPCFIQISPIPPCEITPLHPGHVRAALSRDRMARYTPQGGDQTGTANLDLYPITFQNTVPWPYSADDPNGSAATETAIAFIAGSVGIGPDFCDIRSDYTTGNISSWTALTSSIPTSAPSSWPETSCSSAYKTTTVPSNYGAIVTQLTNEFKWVDAVNKLIVNLKTPFVSTQGSTIVDVQNVATQIYGTVKPQPPASTNVSFGWLDIFDGVMGVLSLASDLPGAAVFGMLQAGGDLAGALIENYAGSDASGGPGSQAYKIHVEAQNLATQLTNQTTQHIAALGLLNNILATDAGKLLAAGSQLMGNGDWEWSSLATNNAITFLNATTVQSSYSALLPPTWLMWNLKPNFINGPSSVPQNTPQTSSGDQTTWYCCATADSCFAPPYRDAVTANLSANPPTYGNLFYSRFQMTTAGSAETSTNEVWSFSQYPTSTEVPGPQRATSLTNDIFGSGSDPSTNLTQGAAYPPAWYRSTYNPPGVFTCTAFPNFGPVLFAEPPHSRHRRYRRRRLGRNKRTRRKANRATAPPELRQGRRGREQQLADR